MNLLDESFPKDQLPLLKQRRIPFRQIGHDMARLGAKDPELVAALHRHRRVTFLTLDWDFFDSTLCHSSYCLVWLGVRPDDAAYFTRRFLKHPLFNATAKRMGAVERVHHDGIDFWHKQRTALRNTPWLRPRDL